MGSVDWTHPFTKVGGPLLDDMILGPMTVTSGSHRVVIKVGVQLTPSEQAELVDALQWANLDAFDDDVDEGHRVVVPAAEGIVDPRKGLQFSYGIDIHTILVVAIASGSAVFIKKLVEQAASDFWIAIKRLLGRIAARKKAQPPESIQVQLTIRTGDGAEILLVLTVFRARFLDDASWTSLSAHFAASLPLRIAQLEGQPPTTTMRKADVEVNASKQIRLHALVNGSSPIVWLLENDGIVRTF